MRPLDLKGKKFNYLTVIRKVSASRKKQITWECICDCGQLKTCTTDHLTRKKQPVKSCGCKKISRGSEHTQWSGFGEISGSWWRLHVTRELFNKSNRHRVECCVTIEQGWDLFLKQNKKCALSGIELTFGKVSSKNTASLDRIDNSKGYILGNIQWVHKHINFMKRNYDQDYFVNLCKLIAEKNI